MNKVWQIIKYEYIRHVLQKRFLVSLLSLPIVILVMLGVTVLMAYFSIDTTPIGYIDHSGVLTDPAPREEKGSLFEPVIEFRPYENQEQAETDLQAGEIQAYYILPEDYPQSLKTKLVYLEEPGGDLQNQFSEFVRRTLMAADNLDPQVNERIDAGSLITITTLDGNRQMREDQWFLIFTPFIAGILFVIVVMTSGGYLLQAVVEEKENRTMEIVITSVTPRQLMTGKIIGNIAVGLSQMVIWLIFGWIGLLVGGQFWPILQDFSIPADFGIVLVLVLLPSFVMVAAIMAAIGSTMTEIREAQQISGLFSITSMIPYYLTSTIMMDPNGTLAIVLSYFPLTAPVTILMRMAFAVVPTWQILTIITILVIFAMFSIWFAGRAFRMGMLRYGKKLTLREIFRKSVEK